MSFKRVAGTDLNHDNWNDEEDAEEVGEFKKASDDIIKARPRKVAKRRIGADSEGSQTLNPFSGFGGFNQGATSTPSPFSFLSKLPSANAPVPKTNGEVKGNPFKLIKANTAPENNDDKNNNSEYFSKIKSLNNAFVDWIKSNIDESNGLCDLTPVFKDYEKYMKEFEELKINKKPPETKTVVEKNEKKEEPKSNFTFGKPASTNSTSVFSSVATKTDIQTKDLPSPPKSSVPENKPFSFGLASTNSSFSFGIQKTSTAVSGAPSLFGNLTNNSATTPFTFANVTQNATSSETTTTDNNEEAENEEPPKNEFVPVVEEDSLYSKRCKVFVKNGSDYAERGIGTLYLKKVDEKVQLIVRADTNLGNIILNIIICDGLPTSRLGKNNVMIVCLPTPESKPPPIPVLVRVKTADEADELLATLEKYKKSSS